MTARRASEVNGGCLPVLHVAEYIDERKQEKRSLDPADINLQLDNWNIIQPHFIQSDILSYVSCQHYW